MSMLRNLITVLPIAIPLSACQCEVNEGVAQVNAQECIAISELGLVLKKIPSGTLTDINQSASNDGEYMRANSIVISNDFYMSEATVTEDQWGVVVGAPRGDSNYAKRNISHVQAVEFCEKLNAWSEKRNLTPKGWEFSLPTIAQWEYAARAGDRGAEPSNLMSVAWADVLPGKDIRVKIKQKKANGFGLYDMMGHSFEWCIEPWIEHSRYPIAYYDAYKGYSYLDSSILPHNYSCVHTTSQVSGNSGGCAIRLVLQRKRDSQQSATGCRSRQAESAH